MPTKDGGHVGDTGKAMRDPTPLQEGVSGEDLSIRRKGLVLVALPLCFQILFIGLLAKVETKSELETTAAIHSRNVVLHAERLLRGISQAQSAIRLLAFTTDPAAIHAYRHALAQLGQERGLLRTELAEYPSSLPALNRLDFSINEILKYFSEQHQRLTSGEIDDARAAIENLQGEKLRTEIEEQMASLMANDIKSLERQMESQSGTMRSEFLVIGVGTLCMIGIAIFMQTSFTRGITSRLAILTENARRMGEGRPLMPMISGADEIAELDRSFHLMAEQLDQALSDVRRQIRDLENTNQDLSRKTRENEVFVYSISHDMRSPLVNLLGFSNELDLAIRELKQLFATVSVPDSARPRFAALLNEDIPQSIHYLQSAVARLSTIIDALLRLARVGRLEQKSEVVQVTPIVRRIVESLSASTTAKKAQIQLHELPAVMGDPAAIEHIFGNLIANAINYLDLSRPGRIEVGRIDEQDSGTVTLFVKDNGVGIAAKHQEKVFVAFQRLNPSLADGEGVGLTLVRSMVEKMNGNIRVESEEGVGSTFLVTLRRPEQPSVPGSNEPSDDKVQSKGTGNPNKQS